MADVAILASQVQATPNGYRIPGAQEIILKSIRVSYDGSGAAGAFVPVLQLVAPGPSGQVVSEYPLGTSVAAGASADVTWFPGVIAASSASSNPAGTLSYTELSVNTPITGTSAAQQTLITSSPVTVDGATQLRIEAYTPTFDIESGAAGLGNLIGELWMDATDLGRVGQANLGVTAVGADNGWPMNLIRYYTPAAGTHTFYLKAWNTIGSATWTAGAGGALSYLPGFLRVSLALPV